MNIALLFFNYLFVGSDLTLTPPHHSSPEYDEFAFYFIGHRYRFSSFTKRQLTVTYHLESKTQ